MRGENPNTPGVVAWTHDTTPIRMTSSRLPGPANRLLIRGAVLEVVSVHLAEHGLAVVASPRGRVPARHSLVGERLTLVGPHDLALLSDNEDVLLIQVVERASSAVWNARSIAVPRGQPATTAVTVLAAAERARAGEERHALACSLRLDEKDQIPVFVAGPQGQVAVRFLRLTVEVQPALPWFSLRLGADHRGRPRRTHGDVPMHPDLPGLISARHLSGRARTPGGRCPVTPVQDILRGPPCPPSVRASIER